MWKWRPFYLVIPVVAPLLAHPAAAMTDLQKSLEETACMKADQPYDKRVQYCSDVIESIYDDWKTGTHPRTKEGLQFVASLLASRATAYERKGDLKDAIADLNEAIKDSPDFEYSYRTNLCKAKLRWGGDVASALEDCNAVLHLTSDKFWIAQALEYRGYAYVLLSKFPEALADFNLALTTDAQPNFHALAVYCRGMLKRRAGDSAGAEADLAFARKNFPQIGTWAKCDAP